VEIKIRVKETATKKLEDARKRIPMALMRGIGEGLVIVQGQAKRNVMTGGRAGLHVRTGHLHRSITHEGPKRKGTKIIGAVGTDIPYGPTHEFGGTIRPKRAQFLTVPLTAAKTAAGAGRGRARDFPNTFIAKGIIFQRIGKRIIPLFVLKRMVRIPKRRSQKG
jgi:phage gpG-like protein